MAELVFRPDKHPETDSVDGNVYEWYAGLGTGKDWADIQGGAGNLHYDDDTTELVPQIASDNVQDKWRGIGRTITVFLPSGFAGNTRITGGTLSLYGYAKVDGFSGWSPTFNIYSAAPASDDDLVNGDFNSCGTTAYCDTAIAYDDIDTAGWNNWVLNTVGIAALSKASPIYISVREATYDAANVEPPSWTSNANCYAAFRAADYGDGSLAPKLTITYDTGVMAAGNFAVVEDRVHYISTSGAERYNLGIVIDDAVNERGNIAIWKDQAFHYVGGLSGKEQYIFGTEITEAVNERGNIGIRIEEFHYVSPDGKERYWLGTAI
jgi:hypothetical protein